MCIKFLEESTKYGFVTKIVNKNNFISLLSLYINHKPRLVKFKMLALSVVNSEHKTSIKHFNRLFHSPSSYESNERIVVVFS